MSSLSEKLAGLSPEERKKLAEKLRQKREGSQDNPHGIAIIGIGCRLPGGIDSPQSFWDFLCKGGDAITEIPPERWDVERYFSREVSEPGKMATRWGGFLTGLDRFDAEFFGIPPREARNLEPQQRLLMECAWEAMEDAGQTTDGLAGSQAGVFVGVHNLSDEYYWRQAAGERGIDIYTSTGNANSIVANRLSYFLDLHGPSLVVDTACSSSLVAVHLAVQSLLSGESDLAFAGGVNYLDQRSTIAFSKLRMMATDGRCKTFDSRADGFVRSEGCGVIVLKREAEALAAGDRVWAVIRGSAVNQDGHTNGLTAPNGLSQRAVIRKALAQAGLAPSEVGYVEAHGTGTSLGDPIEVEAIQTELGEAGEPCALGSVKTNLGHLETAAGITGLIKATLVVRNGYIPPHLHFREINPHIRLNPSRFDIPVEGRSWESSIRIAGVSSFGFGGTNAHAVVSSAVQPVHEEQRYSGNPLILPVSARSAQALEDVLRNYRARVEQAGDEDLANLCYSAACRRSHHPHRAALVAADVAGLRETVKGLPAQIPRRGAYFGMQAEGSMPGLAFVFSGQGGQYAGMGSELSRRDSNFRQDLQNIMGSVADETGWSVNDDEVLEGIEQGDTTYVQPVLFGLQVALARHFMRAGLSPDFIVGHSVGEVAAAHVAGALTLGDAARVIALRAQVSAEAVGSGHMLAVGLSWDQIQQEFPASEGAISLAAINGPGMVTLSGTALAITRLEASLTQRDVFCKKLAGNCAFHSHAMEQPAQRLSAGLDSLTPATPSIPVYSTVTGRLSEPGTFGPEYWALNLRQPVAFLPAVENLLSEGCRWFLELGPQPTLCSAITEIASESASTNTFAVCAMRGNEPESLCVAEAVGGLYAAGAMPDWTALQPAGRFVAPPAYPWHRRKFWLEAEKVFAQPQGPGKFPGAQIRSPALKGNVFELRWDPEGLPAVIAEHMLFNTCVVAGPVFFQLASVAVESCSHVTVTGCAQLTVSSALVLSRGPVVIQTIVDRSDEGTHRVQIHSRAQGSERWTLHCVLSLLVKTATRKDADSRRDSWDQGSWARVISGDDLLEHQTGSGIDLGPRWRALDWMGAEGSRGVAVLRRPQALEPATAFWSSVVVDAGLQCLNFLATGGDERGNAIFPLQHLEGLRVYAPWPEIVYCEIQAIETKGVPELAGGSVRFFDPDGGILCVIDDVVFRRATRSELAGDQDWRRHLFEMGWRAHSPLDVSSPRPPVGFMPAPAELLAVVRSASHLDSLQPTSGDLESSLLTLCAAYAWAAVLEQGSTSEPGHSAGIQELARIIGISEHKWRLFHRLLGILSEEDLIEITEERLTVLSRPDSLDTAAQCARMEREFPDNRAELKLLKRCGESLRSVLTGKADPLSLLFPEGELEGAEKIYQSSPFARVTNSMIRAGVESIVAGLPEDRVIRILEIGAGTGGTTAHLVDLFPLGRTEYVFSDVSATFLEAARKKFQEYPFIRYRLLDVEQDPSEQGLVPAQFDLVIAANVLHATRDLKNSARNACSLLTPGGVMILLEGALPTPWVDLTFGLTEGWWHFEDTDLRSGYPLISARHWTELLQACGVELVDFASTHNVAGPTYPQARIFEQNLLAGRRPMGPAKARPGAPSELWMVLGNNSDPGLAETLFRILREAGHQGVMGETGSSFEALDDGRLRFHPGNPEDWKKVFEQVPGLRGVVDCRPADAGGLPKDPHAAAESVLEVGWSTASTVQALSEADPERNYTIQLVTSGGQRLGGEASPRSPVQASLWGLGRVIDVENTKIEIRLLDVDPAAAVAEQAAAVHSHLVANDNQARAGYRNGSRFVPVLQSLGADPLESDKVLETDGLVLITGGLGDLGLLTAEWLVEQGVRQIALLSRREVPAESSWADLSAEDSWAPKIASLKKMRDLGAQVVTRPVDVSDVDLLTREIKGLASRGLGPVRGVIHAAAVTEDYVIGHLSRDGYANAIDPKVAGALSLFEALREQPLAFFVMFSSLASFVGVPGQAGYAAGNAFLDAFAEFLREQGVPCTSIDWCGWSDAGLAITTGGARTVRNLEQRGLELLKPAAALRVLGEILKTDHSRVAVIPVDPARARESELRQIDPLLSGVVRQNGNGGDTETVATGEIGSGQATAIRSLILAQEDPANRRSETMRHVCEVVAGVLEIDVAEIESDRSLGDLGLDSLTSLEARNLLQQSLGLSLSPTVMWSYPTVAALSAHLMELMEADGGQHPDVPGADNVDGPVQDGGEPDQKSGAEPDEELDEVELLAILSAREKDHG